jgi:hypothetical protein
MEVLVTVLVVVILVAVVALLMPMRDCGVGSLKDAAQLKEIHQSMLVYANDHDGVLPRPGLINRRPAADDPSGPEVEDPSKNTSRHLYSAMIAANYFNTDIVVGPTEVNPQIVVYETYDYAAYDPAADVSWDGDHPSGTTPATETGFLADIGPGGTSHTSYFHLALVGRRKDRWRTTADNTDPLLSTRAPHRGADETSDDYRRSQTLLLHGSKKTWFGNLVFGDNHTEVSETFRPALVTYAPAGSEPAADNVFAAEFEARLAAGDAFLTMTRRISGPSSLVDYRETLLPPD